MKPVLFGVLAGLCWGVGEVLTKQVLASKAVGPLTVVCVRVLACAPLAVALYLLVHVVMKHEPGEWFRAPGGVLVKLLIGPALLAGFGGVVFFYLGISQGAISVVKPIAFTLAPAIAAVLGALWLKEAMNVQKVAGIVLTLAGVALIAGSHGAQAGAAPVGEPGMVRP